MTYEELIKLAGDPNDDQLLMENDPSTYKLTDEGLILLPVDEFNLEHKIQIVPEGFRVWSRDAENAPEEFLGRDWVHEAVCESYRELVDYLYDW